MSEIVKVIRKKNNNNDLDAPIPIGTDGNYVQMKSNLDLEEQLKLGGNKVTCIKTKELSQIVNQVTKTYHYYQIIEWYANQPIILDNNNTPSNTSIITHTVQHNVYTEGMFQLYSIDTGSGNILVETENVNNGTNPIVVIEDYTFNNYKAILIINIFNGYKSNDTLDELTSGSITTSGLLHQKVIQMNKEE